jgi:hypothetical protein
MWDKTESFLNVELKELKSVLKKEGVRSVSIHNIGSVVDAKDGARYVVMKNGKWKRVREPEKQGAPKKSVKIRRVKIV